MKNNNNDIFTNKNVDISFCLPVYNVDKYLKACILSIIAQGSNDFSYEIICIDDGSSDDSLGVLKKLQSKYPQVKIFENEENKGVSYTRNRAVTLAKGKYIWFVDPDDMLYPSTVQKMYTEIEKRGGDVILGNYISCGEDAKLEDFKETPDISFTVMSADNNSFLPHSQTGNRMCAIWAGMFKKTFLTENHLLIQEKMIAQEDTLFYYQFSLRLNSVIKYNLPCYIYRQRATSVMHSKSGERSKKYYVSMRVMYDVYNDHLTRCDYKNKDVLLKKIHHIRQNITVTLALIPDTAYVKKEIKDLKAKGIYPYPFRKEALKTKESLPRRILFYLQPVKPFFWILHTLNKLSSK